MSMATNTHNNNIVVGSGELFLALFDTAGKPTGERYLGDSPGASLAVSAERVTVMSADGPVATRLVDAVRSIERTLTLTLHDMSADNLALFVGAPAPESVPARKGDGDVVADEVHKGTLPGTWVQLGATDANPAGVGQVKTVTVKTTDKSNTAGVLNTDFKVDEALGRVYLMTAAVTGATGCRISYTPAGPRPARKGVKAAVRPRDVTAALRYIEDTDTGNGRNFYAPKCSIAPSGDLALKSRDGEQQIALVCSILDPGAGHAAALYIDGVEA